MPTPHFIFRLDPALKGALAEQARRTGCTMSQVVRYALREKVALN